jgi:MFS family permease
MKEKHDPYSALRFKEFRYFFMARLLLTLAFQVQVIVINWMAYEHTRDPWTLGIMGLIEAIPIMCVSLFGGHYADKFNRRKIILISVLMLIAGSAFLTWFAYNATQRLEQFGVMPVFAVVLLIGIARGFLGPAVPAFSAQLVPKEFYTNAAAWNSTVWQLGSVTGPAIGGICYAKFGASATSFIALLLMLATVVFYMLISNKPIPEKSKEESLWESLTSGIKYVFKNEVIISAITLDLFAVLFGGAVAMLPVFADKVLHVGPDGLGYLRAAPALGAVIMAVVLAYFPPVRNSGRKLLVNVALFGVCMIAFALSKNFLLSFVILLLSGMFDSVSVVIRHTIIQLFTPDEMRGRVSSVNSIFIGASNEIGAFESGLAAKIMGLIPSVIMGGAVTLMVVAAALKFAPNLKNMHLNKHT